MGATLSLSCVSGGGRHLLQSAQNGDNGTVREVLAARPELAVFSYFGNGQNVAHVAAAKGDREVLEALLDALQSAAKAPVAEEYDGELALKEQTITVMTMGRYVKDVINARSNNGQTPLMLACEAGHVSCVNFLLDSGADVFQVDKAQRRSAIHYAAAAGQASVLRALLSEDRLMHTEEGLQPLKNVRVHDMSGQCRYIDCRAENGVTALHLAAVHGKLPCVHVLLAAGASMMVRTVDLDMLSTLSIPAGSTPLHLAAQKGQVAIVQAMLQAHADALGNWTREDGDSRGGRRGWEQDGRIDLRSVANSLRQLPYHVAWQRGFREAAQVLNPTIPIDVALENVRELDEGFGTQRLATLAAYALRQNLLSWLERHQQQYEVAVREQELRDFKKRIILEQRRKEALKLHSQQSAEASLAALDARLVSPQDAGHTFAMPSNAAQPVTSSPQLPGQDLTLIKEHSDELLSTLDWAQRYDEQASTANQCSTAAVQPPAVVEYKAELLSQPTSPFMAGPEAPSNAFQAAATEPPRPNPRPPTSPPAPSSSRPASAGAKDLSSRKSKRRLTPSRPPPPPPMLHQAPSASERALALAAAPQRPTSPKTNLAQRSAPQRLHSRRVSWEEVTPRSPDAANPGWLCSPFASPFAEASMLPLDAVDDRDDSVLDEADIPRMPLSSHPSGVNLADPPEGTAPSFSAAPAMRSLPSRRSSKTPLALPSLRSKKSQKLETSLRVDFQGAASIPGFDNNLDDDEDCGICLDEHVNVSINGCCHKLCGTCALKLCEVNKKPPLCPFCRTFIEGFHPTADSPVKL